MRFAFLTGAGASHGAGKLYPEPPPLGAGLFVELASQFPASWGSLARKHTSQLRKDFERGMSQIWEERLASVPQLTIDMAIYFSQFEPPADRSDCYSRLVATILDESLVEETAFATLNYECVLDIAASRAGLKIAYSGASPPPENLMIWKLHGACNLLPEGKAFHMTIEAASIYEGPLDPVDTPMVRQRYQRGLAIPPVMSVYMPGKPTQTARRFLDQARREWADWVAGSDVVVAIGARPVLEEEYVWRPMAQSSCEVWYIGGIGGEYEQLQQLLSGRLTYLASKFDDAIQPLIVRLLHKSRSQPRHTIASAGRPATNVAQPVLRARPPSQSFDSPPAERTRLVASSTAPAESKARAAYICDGIADNIEIQAAIDELSGGGLLQLRDKFQSQKWFSEALTYWTTAFPPIEERLRKTSQAIDLLPDHRRVSSAELRSTLREAGSAFDSTLRALLTGAGVSSKGRHHDISDFCDFLSSEVPDIHARSVTIRHCLPAGVVVPLEELGTQGHVPAWWTAYTKVKHEESVHRRLGNLENAVRAVCAVALIGRLMGGDLSTLFVNAGIAYPEDSIDMSDERRLFPRAT